MSETLLVLDSHYLCHRAFHTSGHLGWKGKSTGVIFGFLKSLSQLKDEFSTDRIAFCFDGQNLHRRKLYRDYKRKRAYERTPEEEKAYQQLSDQIKELRTEYLPRIGFRNIFYHEGYESDDLMAMMAKKAAPRESIVLVTADSDMFQCLRPGVSIYSPQRARLYTHPWFKSEYKIEPYQWALVKALSGCKSDNVKGVWHIGEKTALRIVRRDLPENHPAWLTVRTKEAKEIVRNNRDLVELPFLHTPEPKMTKDEVTRKKWREVCDNLGMKSLLGQAPIWR